MNTPLLFGFRHALYTVHPTFEFQLTVNIFAFNPKDNLFESTNFVTTRRNMFDFPALWLRIHGVHAHELTRKDRGLITSCTRANFHNDIFCVHWVLWKKCNEELLLKHGYRR